MSEKEKERKGPDRGKQRETEKEIKERVSDYSVMSLEF